MYIRTNQTASLKRDTGFSVVSIGEIAIFFSTLQVTLSHCVLLRPALQCSQKSDATWRSGSKTAIIQLVSSHNWKLQKICNFVYKALYICGSPGHNVTPLSGTRVMVAIIQPADAPASKHRRHRSKISLCLRESPSQHSPASQPRADRTCNPLSQPVIWRQRGVNRTAYHRRCRKQEAEAGRTINKVLSAS